MVIASLPTLLRVKAQAVEDLLQGRVRFLTPAQAGRFEALCSTRTADWLRGSRRYDHITTGELPVELLIPVVHYGMERYGREGAAALCGMTTRSMFRILSDSTSVSFALADRLVTGLDGPGWWLETNERMGWYYAHDRGLER
jgi:plasmid maintenance system antidote protein VapI